MHNAEFQKPDHLAAQYVFSRIAWAILPMTRRFVTNLALRVQGTKRRGHDEDGGIVQAPRSKRRRSSSSGSIVGSTSSQQNPTDGDGANYGNNDNIEYQSVISDGSGNDEEEFAKEQERAMRKFPDVFGPRYDSRGSEGGSGFSSPRFSFSHLEPERAEYAMHDVHTLSWYPGFRRVKRLARQYMQEHPQVRGTSGSEFMESSDFESSPEHRWNS